MNLRTFHKGKGLVSKKDASRILSETFPFPIQVPACQTKRLSFLYNFLLSLAYPLPNFYCNIQRRVTRRVSVSPFPIPGSPTEGRHFLYFPVRAKTVQPQFSRASNVLPPIFITSLSNSIFYSNFNGHFPPVTDSKRYTFPKERKSFL